MWNVTPKKIFNVACDHRRIVLIVEVRVPLWALGYYARNISRLQLGFLRIWIRRFRCRFCRKTLSLLPSFAQPYRLIQNSTIERFVAEVLGVMMSSGCCRCSSSIGSDSQPGCLRSGAPLAVDSRGPPPVGEPLEWWTYLLSSNDGLGATTLRLVLHLPNYPLWPVSVPSPKSTSRKKSPILKFTPHNLFISWMRTI